MGADFYPRLTAAVENPVECNRLVNEQAQVSLLLAGPGVIATLTFAPVMIALLFSAKFHAAVPLLRWICLGATLQVITWPMGFIIVAKARQSIFFWSELAYTAVYVAAAWVGIRYFALDGVGHGLLRILCLPLAHDLPDSPMANWIPLVGSKPTDRYDISWAQSAWCFAASICSRFGLQLRLEPWRPY